MYRLEISTEEERQSSCQTATFGIASIFAHNQEVSGIPVKVSVRRRRRTHLVFGGSINRDLISLPAHRENRDVSKGTQGREKRRLAHVRVDACQLEDARGRRVVEGKEETWRARGKERRRAIGYIARGHRETVVCCGEFKREIRLVGILIFLGSCHVQPRRVLRFAGDFAILLRPETEARIATPPSPPPRPPCFPPFILRRRSSRRHR